MREGLARSSVDYAWPHQLFRPAFDVKLVYLDLNHWISLAKAIKGKKDAEGFGPALEALRAAKAAVRW